MGDQLISEMKKVVIDRYIPYEGEPFDGIAETVRLDPSQITRESVRDADALIVRTRTKCGPGLLDGSKVSIVATATIGIDHLDLHWLDAHGITAVSAPGCNAPAVAQYVLASIFAVGLGQPGMRLGIVGLGHVGSIVASWAGNLGIEILACDPPRERRDKGWDAASPFNAGDMPFVSLGEIGRKADVVTFHTPLTMAGGDRTYHMLDREFIGLAGKAMVINAARGPVADTREFIEGLRRGVIDKVAVDCWEGEPQISTELLRLAEISTPHIAGYSIEGKKRATAMTFNAVLRHLGSERRIDPGVAMTPPAAVSREEIIASYDPLSDSLPLKSDPQAFEHLRNTYNLRHEPATK